MGLGGKTTALGLKMLVSPCHIASLPLAVNIQCHSSRHEEVEL
jgi:fumarate hydratase subunit alpha